MAYTNRTADFVEQVASQQARIPENKRRKISPKERPNVKAVVTKEYVSEAYVILNHITTLTKMLSNVRKPYLTMDARTTPVSRLGGGRNIDIGGAENTWAGIRHLTNEERDQIDLQARVILTRCADRVKEMEALERRRTALLASKTNPLARLIPARLRQDESTISNDFIAAHHASITWFLNRRLAEASQTQKEMQEERGKRQLERTKTLGSGAAREALSMGAGEPPLITQASGGGSWLEGASTTLANSFAATIGAPSPSGASHSVPPPTSSDFDSDDDEDIELSSSQILQFETENANILREVQNTLESVQQAESRLMDISALQMELVTHLTRQTELTDQLFEDAIATTSTVEKGNDQLREAKRRARDGRKWILLFLIGASLSLLFLHYY